MATKKNTDQMFNVCAKLSLDVSVVISAKDIYEALEKIKTLQLSDFVEAVGQIDDGNIDGISYIATDYGTKGFQVK